MARGTGVGGFIARLESTRLAIVIGLIWVAMAAVLFASRGRFSLAAVEAACRAPAPDSVFAPEATQTQAFIETCGASGLAAYRDLQVIDLLYPAVTGVFLASLLALLLSAVAPRARALAWMPLVPLVATAADYAENACAWVLLSGSPSVAVASLLQAFSAVKFATSWISWLLVLALAAVALVRRMRRRGSRRSLVGSGAPAA